MYSCFASSFRVYLLLNFGNSKKKPKPFLLMYFCLLQSPALSPLSANTWQTASKTKENMSTACCKQKHAPFTVKTATSSFWFWMCRLSEVCCWYKVIKGVFVFIVYLQWRETKNVRKGSKEGTENKNISLETVQYWKYWFSKPFQNYRSSFWMHSF